MINKKSFTKRGVFATITSEAETTVTTAGTYYPIAGTFSNNPMEEFQLTADPAVQYTGGATIFFEIDWHATVFADDSGRTVHFGIKKNGTLVDSSVMGTFLKTFDEAQALSGTCVIELSTDDKIQLVLTSDADGDKITAKHYTTTIQPFFIE